MPRIRYEAWSPRAEARGTIYEANRICQEYANSGYDLTLRQLYYQFVARGSIPNTQQSYKQLGDVINKARMAGMLDWNYIEDRTRNLESLSHWSSPASIVRSCARGYNLDKWKTQPARVEVWVEKEALAGVISRAADRYDCAWFSCRGYVSQSEMWSAAQRLGGYIEGGQKAVILHLGDHDPSGIDMTRDITDRLTTFITQDYLNNHVSEFGYGKATVGEILRAMSDRCGASEALEVRRIALNMDQVELYNPPPNPAKITDTRAQDYIARYGYESWELDALDPATLDALISDEISAEIELEAWAQVEQEEQQHRELLTKVSDRWYEVHHLLSVE